ncbi:MAG: hypothetical protein K2O03_01520 [Lachnospiraceae bacterium]|nr:hypothetical protein [Lachnospiraceae bacterium]
MSGEWGLYSFLGAGFSFAAYAAAALLHEGGHALAGYLAGATCLWIRVGGLLWVPGGGIFVKGWNLERPGECALFCPDKRSCYAAALGGCIMNFGTGIMAGMLWLIQGYVFWNLHPLFFLLVIAFSVCSLGMALLNFCPYMKGIGNDGGIAKKLRQEEGFYEKLQRNQQRDMIRLEFGILQEMF